MAEWSEQKVDDSINDTGIMRFKVNTLDGQAILDLDILEEGLAVAQINQDIERQMQPPVAGASKDDFDQHEVAVDVEVGKRYAARLKAKSGKPVSIKAAMEIINRMNDTMEIAKKNLQQPPTSPSGSDSIPETSASLK